MERWTEAGTGPGIGYLSASGVLPNDQKVVIYFTEPGPGSWQEHPWTRQMDGIFAVSPVQNGGVEMLANHGENRENTGMTKGRSMSHLKKLLFFGALRIRKEQDAAVPSLAKRRPAASVIVYDSIKTRMDEALERERNGLTPEEDAPNILASTWLSQVTEEQLKDIGFGFLSHRRLRLSLC
ncbi:hypothetical protein B0H11DRAFT_2232070 [Mycena galericulata]|nr:hypothetical protein B0H11DRAFT_2232070 [Mycena galericulata]